MPKPSTLMLVKSAYATFLLVVNSNFVRILCRFWAIDTLKLENSLLCEPHLVWRPRLGRIR